MADFERKLRHLDYIQAVIIRMNVNSFLLKGWSVTLMAALSAFAAKGSDSSYVIIAYIPLPIFWCLDAFFLCTEKKYRMLYDHVRTLAENQIDFSMSVENYLNSFWDYMGTIFSRTLFSFYGALFLVSFLITYWVTNG